MGADPTYRQWALLINVRLHLHLDDTRLHDLEGLLEHLANKMLEHATAVAQRSVRQFEAIGAKEATAPGAETTLARLAAIGELLPSATKR